MVSLKFQKNFHYQMKQIKLYSILYLLCRRKGRKEGERKGERATTHLGRLDPIQSLTHQRQGSGFQGSDTSLYSLVKRPVSYSVWKFPRGVRVLLPQSIPHL